MNKQSCLDSQHICLTATSEIEDICEPLKSMGITNFIYVKNYYNGNIIHLSNRGDWVKHFYQQNLYKQAAFTSLNITYKCNNSFLLWNSLNGQDVVREAKTYFDMCYGIVLVQEGEGGTKEFFSFAGSHRSVHLVNFFLNNLDLLQRYILYFRDKGEPILKKAEKSPIYLPNKDILRSDLKKASIGDFCDERKVFVKETKINKYRLTEGKHVGVCLSGREIDVSLGILKYEGITELAQELYLSKRTVEKYLEKVRDKLLCRNTKELKTVLMQNNLQYVLVP